ncbi:UNVERIFIED_CONTAM: hypothetical protein PYX00_008755 [Menopon gallinae]|uniref:Uncharacterized protein n=1 Tax=Menopon gallinae TaxID=328185 RepID=A0AAW2HP96_9NEOP
MDFNGPGTSIFQETPLEAFDSNAQREEEKEALEEQRRRDIELKDILETAFNDVSFDNEDCSGVNFSFNHSDSNYVSEPAEMPQERVSNDTISSIDFGKHFINEKNQELQTPIRHLKSIRTKSIDFNNHHESDKYSDQYRSIQQNGSLHDIVDASGGGGDADALLHYNHCIRSNSLGTYNSIKESKFINPEENFSLCKQYQNTDYNSTEQLQVLYDIRVREVHRLTELIDQMRNNHEIERGELNRQLAFGKAENERLRMTESELKNVIVANKSEIENLNLEMDSLKKTVSNLEECRENLLIELETSKMTVNDLERKILAIEKGRKDKTAVMQYEADIRELKEKHADSIKSISDELNRCKNNLDRTVAENEELKHKVIQMSQINDENLAKKSEIIHRLSKQIEESQEQCEKFMKNSFSEDNIKLQMEIKLLKDENCALSSKIETLEKNLANVEVELKQYECLSNFSAFESNELSDRNPDKENEYSEINKKLREELYRALNSQKGRRQEIQALQALIMKKDEQIHNMAEKERLFLAEASKFREDIGDHIAELKKFESLTAQKESENKRLKDLLDKAEKEFETKLKVFEEKCQALETENSFLRKEVADLKTKLGKDKLDGLTKYNEEYMKFHNDSLRRVREETQESFKLEILGKDIEIENLRKEMEEVKNLYVEVYNEKENLLNQFEKERVNLSSVDLDDVKKLQKELEKSRQRILELDLTLRQQYQQEVGKLNATIKQLNFDLEKLKKEKGHDVNEKNKILTENELLKSELEQITAEKNLYFLNCETLRKEVDQLRSDVEILRENSDKERNRSEEEHSREIEDIRSKYEIKIQKLNKEIELMLTRSISTDSKYTSPMKNAGKGFRHVASQGSPVPVQSASTSPLYKSSTQESCTSPISELKKDIKLSPYRGSNRDASILTDPDPKHLSKREVVRMMEKLGTKHEEEMITLENNYKLEIMKLEKKWQSEVDSIREKIRVEMMNLHVEELQELQEKHRIEMENRVEQEKKEAVVALITEWACEVQSLKQSHAEALAQVEKMKMKYNTAKSIALRYKSYFTSKAEQMKEEWKKVEEGYESALKELEKNVHMLVDVREDEVEAKIQSITRAYEHKINRMRMKLEKYEDLLKSEGKGDGGSSSKNSDEKEVKRSSKGPDKLVVPNSHLCRKI